jgi:hypothetical protein
MTVNVGDVRVIQRKGLDTHYEIVTAVNDDGESGLVVRLHLWNNKLVALANDGSAMFNHDNGNVTWLHLSSASNTSSKEAG